MFNAELKSKIDEDICILIKVDNHPYNYICDCGDASLLTVKDSQNTNVVFISHTHIDHFVNFDAILRHQIGIQRRVIICGPEGIIQQVQSRIQSYCWNLIAEDAIVYEVREIKSNGTIQRAELKPSEWDIVILEDLKQDYIYKNDKFQVHFTVLDHKTDSVAYLFKAHNTTKINIKDTVFSGGKWVSELKTAFELGDRNKIISINDKTYNAETLFYLIEVKQGATLGIIMDHAVSEANQNKIQHLFTNTDKVFIESFYNSEDQLFATTNFHSFSTASGEIMKACNVKEAVPVHFSRKYSPEEVAILVEEFQEALK